MARASAPGRGNSKFKGGRELGMVEEHRKEAGGAKLKGKLVGGETVVGKNHQVMQAWKPNRGVVIFILNVTGSSDGLLNRRMPYLICCPENRTKWGKVEVC